MDKSNEKTKSFRMPLLEIVIVVAVFAVVSVFIMKLYMSADRLQRESENVSRAVIEVQNTAELIRGAETFEEALTVTGLEKVSDITEYAETFTSADNGNYTVKKGNITICAEFVGNISDNRTNTAATVGNAADNGIKEAETSVGITVYITAVSKDNKEQYAHIELFREFFK